MPIWETLVQEGVVSVLFYTDALQIACWVHRGYFHISGFKPLFSIVMSFFRPCHRRVAAFEAKQNQLKEQQKAAAKPPGQAGSRYRGLSKEDRAIAERLERLREERKPSEFWRILEIFWVGTLLLGKHGTLREREVLGFQSLPF